MGKIGWVDVRLGLASDINHIKVLDVYTIYFPIKDVITHLNEVDLYVSLLARLQSLTIV